MKERYFVVEYKGEWAVCDSLDPDMIEPYESKDKAEKRAKLLNMADRIINDIQSYAEEMLERLSEDEIKFLREYTCGTIEIEV